MVTETARLSKLCLRKPGQISQLSGSLACSEEMEAVIGATQAVHSVGESNTKTNFPSSAPNRPTFPSQARRGPPRITTTSRHQHRRILEADCEGGGGHTAPRAVTISRDTWQRRCLTCRETRQRSNMTARRVLNACSSCRAIGVAPLLPRKRLQTNNSAPHDNTVVLESVACLWLHHTPLFLGLPFFHVSWASKNVFRGNCRMDEANPKQA